MTLKNRVERLERGNGDALSRLCDEASPDELRALLVLLDAQHDGTDPPDELLGRHGLSRGDFETTLASLPPNFVHELAAALAQEGRTYG